MSWGPSLLRGWAITRKLGLWTRVLVSLALMLVGAQAVAQPANDRPETLKGAKGHEGADADDKPTKGKLDVRVSETGAVISIDGESKGTSPLTGPIEVSAGEHRIEVRKSGFQSVERTISVVGGETASIDVQLASAKGTVEVTVQDGVALRVFIDGKDMGPAPYRGELDQGTYAVSGEGDGVDAPAVRVEVQPGETAEVVLEPGRATGKLEIRIADGKGRVLVDGKEVGTGNWSGELTAGEHQLRVEREGYEAFEREVNIVAGDVRSESIKLAKAAEGDLKADDTEKPWSFDGLYGGFALNAMVSPTGSGNTMQSSCDTLGATSCGGGTPLGGALTGYIGYGFSPIGLELYILGSGDVYEPSAAFDGVNEVEINPLVATPARQEDFLFARVGGGGTVRVRFLWPIGTFRLTSAVGAGLVYRRYLGTRDAVADDGRQNRVVFDEEPIDDISAAFSFELAGHVAFTETASFAFGLNLWMENATDVKTARKNDARLAAEGQVPTPIATPPYDAALNAQFFLMPFLGFHFGP